MQAPVSLVFTSVPDTALAASLARQLVEAGLAACVKALAPCTATYRWDGQIECTDEIPLIIVTRSEHYALLEQHIKAVHPYAVPEILAMDCSNGLPEYLRWVAEVTAPESL